MIGTLLKSIFGGREKSAAPAAPDKADTGRGGFVAFIVDVGEPYFLGTGETFESDQASMRLRVGIPARELARRLIAGQAYVAERFSPVRIAGKWAEVLGIADPVTR